MLNPCPQAPPRLRQEDPEAEKFLQYFYDHCMTSLLDPLVKLPDRSPSGASLSLARTPRAPKLTARPRRSASRLLGRRRRPPHPSLRPPVLLRHPPHLPLQVPHPVVARARQGRLAHRPPSPSPHPAHPPPPRRPALPPRVRRPQRRLLQPLPHQARPSATSTRHGRRGEEQGQPARQRVLGLLRVPADGASPLLPRFLPSQCAVLTYLYARSRTPRRSSTTSWTEAATSCADSLQETARPVLCGRSSHSSRGGR